MQEFMKEPAHKKTVIILKAKTQIKIRSIPKC